MLGTRAGREQYDKMVAHARDLLDDPTVREVTDTAKAGARRLLAEGRTVVSDTTSKVAYADDEPTIDDALLIHSSLRHKP